MTLRDALARSARLHQDRVALRDPDRALSFTSLYERVAAAAWHIARAELAQGPVVLALDNTVSAAVAFLALAWARRPVLALEAAQLRVGFHKRFEPALRYAAVVGDGATLGPSVRDGVRFFDTGELLREAEPDDTPPADDRDAIWLYQPTSGSSGLPKLAMHVEASLIAGAEIYRSIYHLGPDDRILLTVPLAHSFGMVAGLVSAVVSGASLWLRPRFDPQGLLAMAADGATIVIGTPFGLDLLTRAHVGARPAWSVRACLASGAPLSAEIDRALHERLGLRACLVYGTTEVGVIAAQWPRPEGWAPGSVGAPLPGVRVRVVDDDGVDVADGTVGALVVQTPAMFGGYLGNPAATAAVVCDGWYATGDLAWRDPDGTLAIVGRKATFINVGGKKVNPALVEEVLRSHHAVHDALVVGSEAADAGQEIEARVVAAAPVSVAELVAWCRLKLAPHEVPHRVVLVETLPRTGMGKAVRT